MKRKIICRCPGLWDCYNEKGEHVNSIQKTHNGWRCSEGYYTGRTFDTLDWARQNAFCGV